MSLHQSRFATDRVLHVLQMLRRNQLLPTEEFDFSSVLRRSGAVSSVNSHLGVAGAPDKSIFVESLKGLFFFFPSHRAVGLWTLGQARMIALPDASPFSLKRQSAAKCYSGA